MKYKKITYKDWGKLYFSPTCEYKTKLFCKHKNAGIIYYYLMSLCNRYNEFFISQKDLAIKLQIDRSSCIKNVKLLCELNLIYKFYITKTKCIFVINPNFLTKTNLNIFSDRYNFVSSQEDYLLVDVLPNINSNIQNFIDLAYYYTVLTK